MRLLVPVLAVLLALPAMARAQASLVGVWRLAGPGYASELAIQPDGRFSKLDQSGGAQNMISGVVSVMPNPPTLRLTIQDWAPREFCGPLGCTPIRMIAAEMYRFQIGDDELMLSDQQGNYLYYRVR